MDIDNKKTNYAVISVVLGTYNRKNFLKLTIDSIRKELIKFNFKTEIIVVDGGSTDGTIHWLTKQKDIISIIQHNRGQWQGKPIERRSWGYFMNLAFKAAQGKYICMLSDDCLVLPDAIYNAYQLFENSLKDNKKIGGVAFYFSNLPEQKEFMVNYTINNTLMLNHGFLMKNALEEVNYIDEDNYRFYHADDDLALKLKSKGYLIIDSPDSNVEHFLHANIKLRESIYLTESDDLNYLKYKWLNDKGLDGENRIHSSKKNQHINRHENIIQYYRLYRKELFCLNVKKNLNHIVWKTFRIIKNIILFFYYSFVYIIECIKLLFTNWTMLKQKLKKTYNNFRNKKKLSF